MKTKLCLSILALIAILFNCATFAAEPSKPTVTPPALAGKVPPKTTPPPPTITAKGFVLMDANSGYIIAQQNATQRMAPASLTKLMTMYVVSDVLKTGHIHLNDLVPVSETAWRTGGSRMFIQVNTTVPVMDLINGIVVASGNDACVAMAEYISGTQSAFVDVMNKTAADLGMNGTHFMDSTGLPDPNHYSTPLDMANMTRAIINNFPEDYKWYSQKEITYNNIKQPNRNRLLWRDPTVDGLKTGHTDDAGFCLVASALREGTRLIAVVMGEPSDNSRANDTQALLNYGYRFYETHKLYVANVPLTKPRVWFGKEKQANLGLGQDLFVTIPAGQFSKLKANMAFANKLQAPIKKGQNYGTVTVLLNDQTIATQPLVALTDDPEGNIITRLSDHITMFFQRSNS